MTPPRTWAELAVDAKKLTKNGMYGYGFAAGTNNNAAWHFEPYFWTAGGNLEQVDDPGGVKALSFMSRLVKDGRAPSAVVNWGQNNVAQEFMDGKLASQRSVANQLIAAVPLDRVSADEIQHAESRVGVVGSAYPAISSAITTAIQEAVLGKATPSAALTTAETSVKAALAQAKSGSQPRAARLEIGPQPTAL